MVYEWRQIQKTQPTVASRLYTGLRVLKHKPREITIPGNKSCERGYSFLSDSPEDKGVGLVRQEGEGGWPWRDSMKGVLLKGGLMCVGMYRVLAF